MYHPRLRTSNELHFLFSTMRIIKPIPSLHLRTNGNLRCGSHAHAGSYQLIIERFSCVDSLFRSALARVWNVILDSRECVAEHHVGKINELSRGFLEWLIGGFFCANNVQMSFRIWVSIWSMWIIIVDSKFQWVQNWGHLKISWIPTKRCWCFWIFITFCFGCQLSTRKAIHQLDGESWGVSPTIVSVFSYSDRVRTPDYNFLDSVYWEGFPGILLISVLRW